MTSPYLDQRRRERREAALEIAVRGLLDVRDKLVRPSRWTNAALIAEEALHKIGKLAPEALPEDERLERGAW